MNKEIEILKVLGYDKFKCTADNCKITCCEGWDVSIDNSTYEKLKAKGESTKEILANIKCEIEEDEKFYFIDKEINETCPMLDEKGLCEVVKNHGEEYLSCTCRSFPRIENLFEDRKEFSLSCACPEVVEIIGNSNEKITMISEKGKSLESNNLELKLRDSIISIIEEENMALESKLLISFEMLSKILDNKNLSDTELIAILENYENKEYLESFVNVYSRIDISLEEAIEDFNYLFLDIIENYKDVSGLEALLGGISDFAEDVEIEDLSKNWRDYKELFEGHSKLIENCIISKVLASCVNSDIEELTIAFQMIVLEYLLVRYAMFLKYSMDKDKKVDEKTLKEYIVAFSRIIGNNIDAVVDFFSEDFEEPVFEIGYLYFITLFDN